MNVKDVLAEWERRIEEVRANPHTAQYWIHEFDGWLRQRASEEQGDGRSEQQVQ